MSPRGSTDLIYVSREHLLLNLSSKKAPEVGVFFLSIVKWASSVAWGPCWGPRTYKIISFYRPQGCNTLNKYWRECSFKRARAVKAQRKCLRLHVINAGLTSLRSTGCHHSGDHSLSQQRIIFQYLLCCVCFNFKVLTTCSGSKNATMCMGGQPASS